MARILVLYGTLTMNTELVATRVFEVVEERGGFEDAELKNVYDVSDPNDLKDYDFIIFGTSTWGEGDYPPDTEDFVYLLEETKPDLSGVTMAMFGLGETSYEHYCGASKNFWKLMKKEYGANIVGNLFTIDGYPEDEILEEVEKWTEEILKLFSDQI